MQSKRMVQKLNKIVCQKVNILYNNTFHIKTVQNEFAFQYPHPSEVQKTSLINQLPLNEQQRIWIKT